MKSIDIEYNSTNVSQQNENTFLNINPKENENFEKVEIYKNNSDQYKRYLGRLKCFYYVEGEPLIVIGPHWPFFVCLFSVNVTIIVILFNFLIDKINGILFMFGLLIASIQLGSYLFTVLANPGLPKLEYEKIAFYDESRNLRKCKDCKLWINTGERTYHCYDCGICIEGYDHHCPWTSKCIGSGNLKSFYSFVAFTMVLFGYLIISVSLISPSKNFN